MAVEIYLPKMSDHMETGRIIRWLCKEGDTVERGQVILELETDKAVGEIEAPQAGVLKGVRAGDGEEVPVGETVAFIAKPDEKVPTLPPFAKIGAPAAATAAEAAPVEAAQPALEQKPNEKYLSPSGIVPATPVARRVAKELGVDLHLVTGSGPRGRVKEADVRAFYEAAGVPEPAPVLSAPTVAPVPQPAASRPGNGQVFSLTNIQRITGQRMIESVTTAPHFFLQASVDMSRALEIIADFNHQVEAEGGERVSVTAFLVRVAAAALKKHPRVNAAFQNGELHAFSNVNIGVAVGAEQGLAVPVVHDADKQSLTEINHELRQFQAKGKDMRFAPSDLQGGTFTISNLGMYGVDVFNAIINPPQSAILAVGRIIKTPVVLDDDHIVVRPMMTMTLSVDHRSLDGVQGAQFLAEIKRLVENPQLLI